MTLPGDDDSNSSSGKRNAVDDSNRAQDSARTKLLDAALGYAARGWAVFPTAPGAKRPLTAHGVKDATTDPVAILAWWSKWPDANVGIATGAASNLVVFDVDVKGDVDGTHAEKELHLASNVT